MGALDVPVDRASNVPLGVQLVARIRRLVEDRTLAPGDRLPSLRELAASAGVNVNTVRVVYGRLESEGLVQTAQGRGTFVTDRGSPGNTRKRLRREIEQLEAALVRLPLQPESPRSRPSVPGLLSTEELEVVRDGLVRRLRELDAQRATVLRHLEDLRSEDGSAAEPGSGWAASRRSTPSLVRARIRWLGA